jgi:hypothetical protein
MPARKPASQARWTGEATLSTRSRLSLSSSPKGAVWGRRADADMILALLATKSRVRIAAKSIKMFFLKNVE